MELEWDAARARVRAERKCGELLAQTEKGIGARGKGVASTGDEPTSEYKETCDRAGINKDQAANYQKLAAVPDAEFENAVANPAAKPSTAHILKPKQQPPKRMDADALYLWGVLREFRSRNLFDKDLNAMVCDWTEAMSNDAKSIIPQLKKWVDDYVQ